MGAPFMLATIEPHDAPPHAGGAVQVTVLDAAGLIGHSNVDTQTARTTNPSVITLPGAHRIADSPGVLLKTPGDRLNPEPSSCLLTYPGWELDTLHFRYWSIMVHEVRS